MQEICCWPYYCLAFYFVQNGLTCSWFGKLSRSTYSGKKMLFWLSGTTEKPEVDSWGARCWIRLCVDVSPLWKWIYSRWVYSTVGEGGGGRLSGWSASKENHIPTAAGMGRLCRPSIVDHTSGSLVTSGAPEETPTQVQCEGPTCSFFHKSQMVCINKSPLVTFPYVSGSL